MAKTTYHRVVFFIEYRHCMFRARRGQRDNWNKWCRYSIDFRLRRHAEACAKKIRRAIKRRRMQKYEEVRVQRRELERGERMAR